MNVRRVCALILFVIAPAGSIATAADRVQPDTTDVRYFCPIRWDERHQEIDGFGMCAAFHQAENLRTFSEDDQRRVLDLLFSTANGAGFSIVRNIIGDGGEIGDGRQWGQVKDGPTASIEPREGEWNWTGDEGQIWFMREAAKRGCTRYFSTAWSPPAWMKTNGSVTKGGKLRPDKYQAYAEYLAAYVRGYKERHGIDIYAISPANEPDLATDYSSCEWTGQEFHAFLKQALIPVWEREGITARIVLGEHTIWTDAFALPSLQDPEVAPHVDVVASHAYFGENKTQYPLAVRSGAFVLPKRLGKRVWQTEVSSFDPNDPRMNDAIYWAKFIHSHLVHGNVSAWFYWWGIAYGPDKGNLVYLDLDRKVWTTSKRTFAIGNFARFVRPGFVRVGAESNPAPDVFVTAFVDPASHRRVVVAVNSNVESCAMLFPKVAQAGDVVAAYRTSEREDLAKADASATSTLDIETTLPGESVTTFVFDR